MIKLYIYCGNIKKYIHMYSGDFKFILKILGDEGVVLFESDVFYFLIEIAYEFVWNVLYKAKILSKFKRKKKLDIIDIKLGLTLQLKQLNCTKKIDKDLKKIINVINHQPLPKKLKNFQINNIELEQRLNKNEYNVLGNL